MDAAVGAVAVWQVRLERFGLGHFYHLGRWRLARIGAGARATTLLNLLTEETLEEASKSRLCSGVRVALSTQTPQEKWSNPRLRTRLHAPRGRDRPLLLRRSTAGGGLLLLGGRRPAGQPLPAPGGPRRRLSSAAGAPTAGPRQGGHRAPPPPLPPGRRRRASPPRRPRLIPAAPTLAAGLALNRKEKNKKT